MNNHALMHSHTLKGGLKMGVHEMKLVLRNRTARYYALTGSLVVSLLAGAGLLIPGPVSQRIDLVYAASIYAPLTYGMLAFSWNGTCGVGLFSLPIPPGQHVLGRLVCGGVLAVPPAAVMTLFALLVAPDIVLLPLSAAVVAVSVLLVPSLIVSLLVPRNLDANARPLSSYRRFAWQHYSLGVAALMPVYIASKVLPYESMMYGLAGAAAIGVAALPIVIIRAARFVARRIPGLSDALLTHQV